MSDKKFDPGMKDTCELKEAWADGKKLYYVEDIPGLLEQIASLNKQLAKASEVISECWRLVGNDVDSKSTLPEHVNALNERVKGLESELDFKDVKIIDLQHQVGTLEFNQVTPNDLNKFAIERKIEELIEFRGQLGCLDNREANLIANAVNRRIEQLRKEQE